MKKTVYTCDRCGKEIKEGVVYTLICYADDVRPGIGPSTEASAQNIRQNMAKMTGTKELCRECKDALTDGLFIL